MRKSLGPDVSSPPKTAGPYDAVILVGMACAAFMFRLACLFEVAANDLHRSFVLDSDHFRRCAEHLARGDWFFPDLAYSCPLYPIFLAIASSVFEGRFFPVRILQIGIDVATGLTVYWIALQLIGSRFAARMAAAFYFFYGTAILYSGLFLDTTLVAFIHTLFLASLLKAKQKGRLRDWAFSGAVLAACLLIKANLLFFIPFLIIWFFEIRKKPPFQPIRHLLVFFAVALVLLGPFAAKNHRMTGIFSPFPLHGGLNFYIGNNSDAKGYYMSLPGIADQYPEQFTDSVRIAEKLSGKNLTAAQSSGVWFRAGFRSIARDPERYLGIIGKKMAMFWNGVRVPSNINYYFYQKFVAILKWPWISFGWLAPVAFLGILLSFGTRSASWKVAAYFSIAYFLSVVSLFVTTRYRFPCVPILSVFASFGLFRFFEEIRARRWGRVAVLSMFLAGCGWFVNRDLPETRAFKSRFENDYNNLGIHFDELRKRGQSLKAYRAAIKLNPLFPDPYYNIGLLFVEKGNDSRAACYFRKAVSLWPQMWYAHYQLAKIYERMGRRDSAIAEYEKTLEISPGFADAQSRLGILHLSSGNIFQAMAVFSKVRPENEKTPAGRGQFGRKGSLPDLR